MSLLVVHQTGMQRLGDMRKVMRRDGVIGMTHDEPAVASPIERDTMRLQDRSEGREVEVLGVDERSVHVEEECWQHGSGFTA